METPRLQPAKSRRQSLLLVGLVAFCAAFVTGSCGGFANGSNVSNDVLLFALLSAGIAAVIGGLFIAVSRKRRKTRVYAVIAVASYVTAEVGAWWVLFVVPAFLAGLVAIFGGILAGYFANDEVNAVGYHPRIAALLAIAAVGIAATVVVFSFYQSGNVFFNRISLLPFALVVGVVPPLVAAITAPVLVLICRRRVLEGVG